MATSSRWAGSDIRRCSLWWPQARHRASLGDQPVGRPAHRERGRSWVNHLDRIGRQPFAQAFEKAVVGLRPPAGPREVRLGIGVAVAHADRAVALAEGFEHRLQTFGRGDRATGLAHFAIELQLQRTGITAARFAEGHQLVGSTMR